MGELISKKCTKCEVRFETVYPFQKLCYRCGHPLRKPKKKVEKPYRELTEDTEFLVCVYYWRGDSAEQIGVDLDRNPNQISDIVYEAKKSGRYNEHIKRHIDYAGDTRKIKEDIWKD